jgi:hypothetical protein
VLQRGLDMDGERDLAALYRLAFEKYGAVALWSNRPVSDPQPTDAMAITRQLRTHGGMDGRRLAERIEKLCLAVDSTAIACSADPCRAAQSR